MFFLKHGEKVYRSKSVRFLVHVAFEVYQKRALTFKINLSNYYHNNAMKSVH